MTINNFKKKLKEGKKTSVFWLSQTVEASYKSGSCLSFKTFQVTLVNGYRGLAL